jgi:hypothetical protein
MMNLYDDNKRLIYTRSTFSISHNILMVIDMTKREFVLPQPALPLTRQKYCGAGRAN